MSKQSPSPRRAWIEMFCFSRYFTAFLSPSPRRAWIEIFQAPLCFILLTSPSPRRAWIEMVDELLRERPTSRRPPHGGRGLKCRLPFIPLLPLSRPPHGGRGLKYLIISPVLDACFKSTSPRRAWIEILYIYRLLAKARTVALPTEGVD